MALILLGMPVRKAYNDIPRGASSYYIMIQSIYLSEPYGLKDGVLLRGKIMDIRRGKLEFPELKDKEITFILKRLGMIDQLFITYEFWANELREYGLVQPGYILDVSIRNIYNPRSKEEIAIYVKRDLIVANPEYPSNYFGPRRREDIELELEMEIEKLVSQDSSWLSK
ncbi:MAG: hypothetical protein J7K21_07005 [Desulfurococcales archaeon]|nr:hypothetical protein [Desulfurococcales archaeon]